MGNLKLDKSQVFGTYLKVDAIYLKLYILKNSSYYYLIIY